MIRVSVLYPKSEGATFDHEYYRTTHVPMAVNGWKPARTEIDKGVDGPFEAAVHFFFESAERFQACMGLPVTGELMADLPNYTNIKAQIQVSEVCEP
jgi:uncharacterized protein (TIGR02118 family)